MATETNLQAESEIQDVAPGPASPGELDAQHNTNKPEDGLKPAEIRKPIFIAADRIVVDIIEQFLVSAKMANPAGEQNPIRFITTNDDGTLLLNLPEEIEKRRQQLFNLEVVLISDEVGRKINETYWFGKLNEKQQENYKRNKHSKKLAEQAFATASNLIPLLQAVYNNYSEDSIYLTESAMKSALLKLKKNVSHSNMWEMLELLRMFGYLAEHPDTVELARQKKKFHVALLPNEQMLKLELELTGVHKSIANSKLAVKELQTKLKNIKNKIKRNATKQQPTTDIEHFDRRSGQEEQSDSGTNVLEGVSASSDDTPAIPAETQRTVSEVL